MKKKLSKAKKLIISVIAVVLVALACVGVVLAVSLYSTAQFEANTITLTASTNFSSTSGETTLSFTKPGDSTIITATTTNETSSVLQCYYTLTIETTSTDGNLEKAVLVYFNDEYIGTLAQLKSTDENLGKYVAAATYKGSTATSTPTASDTFTFELHNGADESVYDDKSVGVKITAYTRTADYGKNIFVDDGDELENAVSNVNSGLLDSDVKIVLLGDVDGEGKTLEVTAPCNINLNGHTLSNVTFTCNSTTAYVWCSGSGTCSAEVTLTSYDSTTLNDLLVNAAKENLKDGVKIGKTVSIFGVNGYYAKNTEKITITMGDSSTTSYAFAQNDSGVADVTTGTIGAKTVTRTQVESITVCDTEIEFKVYGADTVENFVNTYLKNIPDADDSDNTTDITCDLFLPTAIDEVGATIEWTSSNPDVMDNTGKIVAGSADKEKVTLTAAITVNGKTTTTSFSFTVSVHTHEINFYQFVQSFSPVIIYEIAVDGDSDSGSGVYQLPIVGESSSTGYDYREDYISPSKSTLWTDVNTEKKGQQRYFEYDGYRDIGLTKLTYTAYEEYTYITLDGTKSTVYVENSTLQTYAKVKVTGTFATGDEYETDIIVIISMGTDTTVFDETFEKAEDELAEQNILKNMLASRIDSAYGFGKEEAYIYVSANSTTSGVKFELSYVYGKTYYGTALPTKGTYTEADGYTLDSSTYTVTDDEGNEYTAYKIVVDPTTFANTETSVDITVIATWSGTSRESIKAFTAPAAVHTSDFDGDTSLFNSIKAQIYQQLPTAEQVGTSGFSNNYATDSTADYILVRDIIGDTEYMAKYTRYESNPYLYSSAETYAGCKELWFYTDDANSASYTDSTARDFAALINWATGSTKVAASTVVTNSAVNETDLTSTLEATADGKEYLTENEIAVLKEYYIAATGATETEWNTIWNQVAEEKAGYVITDASAINVALAEVIDSDSLKYYKYTEIYQWATDFRDNDYDTQRVEGASFAIDSSQGAIYDLISLSFHTAIASSNVPSSVTVNETRTGTKPNSISNTGDVAYTWYYSETDSSGNVTRAWYYHYATAENSTALSLLKYNIAEGNYKINSCSVSIGGSSYDATDSKNGVVYLDDCDYASYLDDDTSYITPGELSVIFAYLYSRGTDSGDYIEAFFDSAVIPTYFLSDGIKTLMSDFYKKAGIALGGESGFTTSVKTTTAGNNTTTQKVTYSPTVASLEGLSDALTYFMGLEQVYICGTDKTPAFLSEYGLSTAGARLRDTADGITTLVLQHVAENYVTFNLTGIKNYAKLKKVDVSNNSGISNIAPLVNYRSGNYSYVNVSNLGLDKKYYEYIVQEMPSSATVVYGDDGSSDCEVTTKSGTSGTAVGKLSDVEQLLSEYLYASTSSDGSTIYWRIESGNRIYSVNVTSTDTPDAYDTIESAEDMQYLVSQYYYCASAVEISGYTFYDNDNASGASSYSFAANTAYLIRFYSDTTYTTSLYVEKLCDGVNVISDSSAIKEKDQTTGGNVTRTETEITDTATAEAAVDEKTSTVQFEFRTYNVKTNKSTFSGKAMYADVDNSKLGYAYTSKSNGAYVYNDEYKMCLLNEADYRILTGQTTVTGSVTLGVDISTANFKTVTIEFDDGVTTITNNTEGEYYYMYFPSTGTFVSNNLPVNSAASITTDTSDPSALRFYVTRYVNVSSNSTYTTGTYGKVETKNADGTYGTNTHYYSFGGYSEGKAFGLTSGESTSGTVTSSTSSIPTALQNIYIDPDGNNSCTYPVFNASGADSRSTIGWGIYDWKWGAGSSSNSRGQMDIGSTWYFSEADLDYKLNDKTGTLTYTANDATTTTSVSGVYDFGVTTTYTYVSGTKTTVTTVEGSKYYYYTGTQTTYNDFTLYKNSLIEAIYDYTYYEGTYKIVTYTYWYTTSIGGDKVEFTPEEGSTITFSYYASYTDGSATTEMVDVPSSLSVTYTTPQEGTTEINNTTFTTLYTYVSSFSDSSTLTTNISNKVAQLANDAKKNVMYQGQNLELDRYTAGELASKTYKYNTFYTYTLAADGTLSWYQGSSISLTAVLNEANEHFDDELYGDYYGMYYAYSGVTITDSSGIVFTDGYIYRIVVNSDNSAFTWEATGKKYYSSYATSDILSCILANSWTVDGGTKTNAYMVGAIFEVQSGSGTADEHTKAGDFYTIVYDESSGEYSMRSVMNIDYYASGETATVVKFINTRMFSILQDEYWSEDNSASQYHTGTGGTETVEICAFTHTKNSDGTYTDVCRYYTVEVVG